MHIKNVVNEFYSIQVKIIDASLEEILFLVTEPPDKSITGHIWMGIAIPGKKKIECFWK